MNIAHEERFKNEAAIFSLRAEVGMQEVRKWLYAKRDDITDKWVDLAGDDLIQLKGEARVIRRMIKMIDQGPTTKGEA